MAQRCLYGVDKNPMAVDLAKLSLWLATLAKDHPFTFLDHALKCGDSLVGLTKAQILGFHWKPEKQRDFARAAIEGQLSRALEQRRQIREAPDGTSEVLLQERLQAADGFLNPGRRYGDLVVSAFFAADNDRRRRERLESLSDDLAAQRSQFDVARHQRIEAAVGELRTGPHPVVPFHWEIEFPEVFDRANGGFDAFVGNPPFAGKNTMAAGHAEGYPDWLQAIHEESHGNSDLVAHFFRRAFKLLRRGGSFGLIATNTIGQGDTRSTGLRWICLHGGTIYAASRRKKWPGQAAVIVSVVHVAKGSIPGPYRLDDREVPVITAYLFHAGGHDDPQALRSNEGMSFQGCILLGMGFTFDDSRNEGTSTSIAEMERFTGKKQAKTVTVELRTIVAKRKSCWIDSPWRWNMADRALKHVVEEVVAEPQSVPAPENDEGKANSSPESPADEPQPSPESVSEEDGATASLAIAETGEVPAFRRFGTSESLVVMLHAFNSTRHDLKHVSDEVAKHLKNADQFAPDMPVGFFSFADPTLIVCDLVEEVQKRWDERMQRKDRKPYQNIIIVGHSLGAVFARKLYIYANGEPEHTRAPFEQEAKARGMGSPRDWAGAINRIVLLSGMNRGWDLNPHVSLKTKREQYGGVFLGHLLRSFRYPFGKRSEPLAFHVRRGDPFMVDLRLQWLEIRQRGHANALVVQVLGSRDDVVSPDDDVDLICGRDFVYLDMPHSGHYQVLHLDTTPEGKERRVVFERALKSKPDDLKGDSITPNDAAIPDPDKSVKLVVFVIHGIRDQGHWTNKVARRVVQLGKVNSKRYATKTASYGYFPILDFIIPSRRRAKAIWLMDEYIEARARYPEAAFHYVGHSNGTLLLGHALRKYLGCRFERVVFAGSPLNRKFFQKPIKGQIVKLLNYVASNDLVVGTFPKGVQWLSTDLGSAGHDGLIAPANSIDFKQTEFVQGGHGAAIVEANWNAIAEFIHADQDHAISQGLIEKRRKLYAVVAGWLSQLVVVPAICLLFLLFLGIIWLDFWSPWPILLPAFVSPILLRVFVLFVLFVAGWVIVNFLRRF